MTSTKLSANDAARNRMAQRLAALERRIADACANAGRPRDQITLLPVSKTQSSASLQCALALGLHRFGENYLQEALGKITALPEDCEWHFIGPIQSNKTRAIAEHFDWVHSLERAKVATRLNAQRPAGMPALKVCLQVNVSGEQSKSGVAPDELPMLVAQVRDMPRLQLMGLMCIPEPSDDPAQQRARFGLLRQLRDAHLPDAPVLSMGMSADLESAIAEGSTLLRVGTALFGPRTPSPTETP